MRVLHFVSTLNRNSGVMRVIMNYYTHIDRKKIQFDFLYFIESEISYADEIRALGGNVYYIPKPGTSLRSIKALKQFFAEHGKEYVWLHNHENYLTAILYPLARKYGIKNVAVHSHLTEYSDKKLSALRNHFLCMPIRYLPVQRVACSRAAARFLYSTEQDVYVMQNMINADFYAYQADKRNELRRQYDILDTTFVIGHIGRFVNQKNHIFLIERFSEFHKTNLDSKLLLVGSGPLEENVKIKAQELNIEDAVIFAGQQKDMQGYLSMMDVFVLPSLFEGLPMVALEAQANGLQCLLADTITEETAVGENVHFCSLENTNMWLDMLQQVKKNEGYNRALTAETKKKMDMIQLAKQLEQYYCKER